MVNYDLPWNPNRIEQRFGRIHRIGGPGCRRRPDRAVRTTGTRTKSVRKNMRI